MTKTSGFHLVSPVFSAKLRVRRGRCRRHFVTTVNTPHSWSYEERRKLLLARRFHRFVRVEPAHLLCHNLGFGTQSIKMVGFKTFVALFLAALASIQIASASPFNGELQMGLRRVEESTNEATANDESPRRLTSLRTYAETRDLKGGPKGPKGPGFKGPKGKVKASKAPKKVKKTKAPLMKNKKKSSTKKGEKHTKQKSHKL